MLLAQAEVLDTLLDNVSNLSVPGLLQTVQIFWLCKPAWDQISPFSVQIPICALESALSHITNLCNVCCAGFASRLRQLCDHIDDGCSY